MSDRLHDYIRENRSAFDQLQPPDIWSGVASGIKHKGFTFKPKNYKSMIKYGFGASAIVVATFVALNSSNVKTQNSGVSQAQSRSEKNRRSIFDTTPSVITAFVATQPVATSQPTRTPKPADADQGAETPVEPPMPPDHAAPPAAPSPPLPPAAPQQAQHTQVTPVLEISGDDSTNTAEFNSIDSVFKGIKRVEVNGQVCHITITSHQSDEVKVRGEIKEGGGDMLVFGNSAYKRKEYKIKVLQSGDLLKVWIADHKPRKKTKCSPTAKIESYLTITVPENTSMKAYNGSGNITLSGPLNTKAELKSSYGNIIADNVNSDLNVSASSGNITVSAITGKLKSASSFGNQKFDNIAGDIYLRSNSGEITVNNLKGNADIASSFGHQRLSDIKGNVITVSASGDIIVKRLTGNATIKSSFGIQDYEFVEGDITSSSSSGDIKISDHKGHLALKTSFGNIRGKNITLLRSSEFKASSGNIVMNFTNKVEELSFDLTCSSGYLTIEKADIKKKTDKQLKHGNGPIMIRGVSSFGNQNYN